MLFKMAGYMGGIELNPNKGDVPNFMEFVQADATGVGINLTAYQLASGILSRSGPGANFNDTLPTAQALIQALQGQAMQQAGNQLPGAANIVLLQQYPQYAQVALEPNSTYRFLYLNTSGFQATLVVQASSGVTFIGNAAMATITAVEWLVTFSNTSTPAAITADTTNASPNLTNVSLDDLNKLSIGMSLFGTNVGAFATVQMVDYANNRVIATVNSTATSVIQPITATPSVNYRRLRSSPL